MARNRKDEDPEEKGPSKKEKRSARRKAKTQGEKPQYKEKEVDVKASSHAKAHKETRRVRVEGAHGEGGAQKETEKLTGKFDTGATAGGRQRERTGPKQEREGRQSEGDKPPEGVSYEDWKKFGSDAGGEPPGTRDSEIGQKGWTRSGAGGQPPPGSYRGYEIPNPADPDSVLDRIAVNAIAEYQNMSDDIPQRRRQEQAARLAIENTRANYKRNEDAPPGKKGLNLSKVNIGSVSATAFGPKARRPSVSETAKMKEPAPIGESSKYLSPIKNRGKPKESLQAKKTKADERAYANLQATRAKPKITNKKIQDAVKAKTQAKTILQPGQQVAKASVPAQEFLRNAPAEERDWINTQMNDPKGLFFGAQNNRVPGAYRRWQRYVNARQAGYKAPVGDEDPANIKSWLTTDTRGRTRTTNENRRYKGQSKEAVDSQFTKGIVRKEGIRTTQRYGSLAPSHEDLGVGIRAPGIRSKQQIREDNPDASSRDLFEIRQSDMQSVAEFMENQRQSHETRQEQVLGRTAKDSGAGPDDRVVFFTTSTGYPAPSVAANSLLGQYIVKKRKKMVYDEHLASRAQLKGEFPSAVRDQHVVELATGISVGAQGRYGAFKHIGYRVGSNKSKGYGKMLPVGSQILRDSTGQPIYDRNGNVRYTEGFTRPFDVRPGNDIGLKIYLG